MKKTLLLLAVVFLVAGCVKNDTPNPDQTKKLDFSLFEKISVNASLPDGTRCLLFTSYPYVDGDMVGKPVMVAYAPFNKNIRVPKSVETLYMYANGELHSFPRGDIKLAYKDTGAKFTPATVVSRADEPKGSQTHVDIDPVFLTKINLFYPEGVHNVTDENLKFSSDLIAPDGVKKIWTDEFGGIHEEYWGATKVWITYIDNGGSNIVGSLWCYYYNVDEEGNPTSTLEEVEATMFPIFSNIDPVANPDYRGTRIYLGEFGPGVQIGFKFKGNTSTMAKYSTPYYNNLAWGKEATCGIIRTWEYEGATYATLGMENRIPGETSWDCDFNDMICLIEADPLFVDNYIEPPFDDPEETVWEGYWLFEDNYPAQGDYDFNDLVVKYAITETEREAIIDLEFLARGASLHNSFGINKTIYLTDLQGYQNVFVEKPVTEPYVMQIKVPLAAEYIPMMNNSITDFDLKSYFDNEEKYPCVLEIPIVDGSIFEWCIEKIRIDTAYPRYMDWVDSGCVDHTDWYLDMPVDGTVWRVVP